MPRCRIAMQRHVFAVLFPLAALASNATGQSLSPAVTRLVRIDSAIVNSVAVSSDGRWIVYEQGFSEQESHLFVRSASGGTATQLTPPGKSINRLPRFTPSGDRVVYRSTLPSREAETNAYVMALPFDTRTGRATGTPRQVSLEPAKIGPGALAISGDGKKVAYVQCCEVQRLRVVPITGGNARTIAEPPDPRGDIGNLAWTDDGGTVLYVTRPADGSVRLMRAPLAGGGVTEIRRSPVGFGALAPGGHRSAFIVSYGAKQRQRELRVLGEDGSVVERVRLPDGFDERFGSWSPDGRVFVNVVSEQRAVIRLASTTGAPTRTLSSGADYDWPDGWSPDSRTVYYETSSRGAPALGAVTIDGVQRASLESPGGGGDYGSWGTVVGRYAIGLTGWIDSTRQRVIARNLDDGTTLSLTDSKPRQQPFIRGGGGTYGVDGNAYVHYERNGDALELRSIVPGERSRLLWTFRSPQAISRNVAVHNGRVIYSERARDSLRFMFAAHATDTPRPIATIPAGPPNDQGGEIAWTSDGRHVALGGPASAIYVLALAADGTPEGALQRYQLPFEYFYELSFLNDGRRLTMIAQPRGGPNAVVALVSLDDPARPVILSETDGTSAWGHLISPDGQWTAYAAELPPRGSTIYRVDLSSTVRTAAAPKR